MRNGSQRHGHVNCEQKMKRNGAKMARDERVDADEQLVGVSACNPTKDETRRIQTGWLMIRMTKNGDDKNSR